ncbi:hypothetical protein SLEP1_g26432 [Rubroshorea leprosula]|uniref:Aminotransferase-like plant mobile domain-containing protein n=1 Tax=Rubroshorea leprosula TaxID=152421 RepID=A0AAV5JWL5_9ROSI|nr:hypothetical protein SLEP1_g26432 [Rubroshorea leprosula]
MAGSSTEGLVEVREEAMVSLAGGTPTIRKAHFIRPSTDSIVGRFCKLHSLCQSSVPTTFEPTSGTLNVKFNGWRYPQKNWTTWVQKMASLHESTWKKAGIFEAVMNSTYKIQRNDDLVFGVAERWFHGTKSFIFPWGEATITLEDVMILGGYSVLGSPVFITMETEELKETEKKLKNARKELIRTAAKKADQCLWKKKFMATGSEIEHEAFLALWLSRFVFPSNTNSIAKRVFPMAIHLARGNRVSLAPAVLANIYRDLSRLKEIIVEKRESNIDEKNKGDRLASIILWSQLQLVQVWVWERFSVVQPKPNLIRNSEPRLARWHGLKYKVKNMRSVLDSAKASFYWRPYAKTLTNWKLPKFYAETEMWVSVGAGLGFDDEVLSFARCLMVSELVGLDSVEQYLPHRVSLQFGIDQDLPGYVPASNGIPEIAWNDYTKSVKGGRLYIPSRFFEADVTTRYLEWWKESVLSVQDQGASSLACCFSVRSLKSSKRILRGKEKDSNATSARPIAPKMNLKRNKEVDNGGLPLKLLKRSAPSSKETGVPILLESSSRSSEGSARCSEGKKKTNAASPIDVDSESSVGVSPVEEEENTNFGSASSPFRTSKEVLDDRARKELDNSPFPPGFPPKCKMQEAKGSVDETSEIIRGVLRSLSKLDDDFEKLSEMESHSSDFVDEDKLTITEMWRYKNKIDNVECREPGSHSSDSVNGDQLTTAEAFKNRIDKVECNGRNSSSPCQMSLRSLSKLDDDFEKLSELESHSLDSFNEDKLTVTEIWRSKNMVDEVECIEQSNGRNSSSPCQMSLTTGSRGSSRCVELPTTNAEKLKPSEVARGGSKGSIQGVIENLAENQMVNNDCSADLRAVGFDERESDRNSNKILMLSFEFDNIESRIGKVERLLTKLKTTKSCQKGQ